MDQVYCTEPPSEQVLRKSLAKCLHLIQSFRTINGTCNKMPAAILHEYAARHGCQVRLQPDAKDHPPDANLETCLSIDRCGSQ